jgi:hypothetical protein
MSLSFAELDNENIVIRCVMASSREWCEQFLGGRWVFDPNQAVAGQCAGIGYTYDEALEVFISPQPFESWVLNEKTCLWEAPVPYPTDGAIYVWDEETVAWVEVVNETD